MAPEASLQAPRTHREAQFHTPSTACTPTLSTQVQALYIPHKRAANATFHESPTPPIQHLGDAPATAPTTVRHADPARVDLPPEATCLPAVRSAPDTSACVPSCATGSHPRCTPTPRTRCEASRYYQGGRENNVASAGTWLRISSSLPSSRATRANQSAS